MFDFKEFFGLAPDKILLALGQTLYMVGIALIIGTLIGVPVGFILVLTKRSDSTVSRWIYAILNQIINIIRSIPFVILLIFIQPFTKIVIGTTIGSTAAIVPLAIYIVPYMSRLIEGVILEVNPGIVEAAESMGATTFQTVRYFLFPETFASIILSLTSSAIALIGASAMAGMVGGGGIGNLALTYGYQRFNTPLMVLTVIISILLVQLIQTIGSRLYTKLKNHA